MAEGILRQRAADAGLAVNVSSAGLLAGGSPATPDAVDVVAQMGIQLAEHVSRRLDRNMIEDADLVLAMTREHLREAVVTDPAAFGRIFTLRELVRRLGQSPHAALADLHRGRKTADYMASNPDDDVADPVGQSRKVYAATAAELDALLTQLVDHLDTLIVPARSTKEAS
jgi:protein-tyrosine-phosphatase